MIGTDAEIAARQALAEEFASDIQSRAAVLMAMDHELAAKISAAIAPLDNVQFDDSPSNGISVVDYKTSPPIPQPGTPDDPANAERHPVYPDRKPNGRFAEGNSGVDGDAAATYTFDDLEALGIPLVRQEVAVRVTDPNTGNTYTRYYDALQPTDVPGQYIGLEHKVNNSPLTANQRTVDDLVSSGIPATGKLNGLPIEIVDTQLIRTDWPPSHEAAIGIPDAPTGGTIAATAPAKIGDALHPPPLLTEGVGGGGGSWGNAPLPSPDVYAQWRELAKDDGEVGNVARLLLAMLPTDPSDPNGWA